MNLINPVATALIAVMLALLVIPLCVPAFAWVVRLYERYIDWAIGLDRS